MSNEIEPVEIIKLKNPGCVEENVVYKSALLDAQEKIQELTAKLESLESRLPPPSSPPPKVSFLPLAQRKRIFFTGITHTPSKMIFNRLTDPLFL